MDRPHHRRRRPARAALAAIALAVVLAGCGIESGSGTGGEPGEKTLTVALTADVRSLWANSTTVQREINVTSQINEKLLEFSPDGADYEPRLAESWEQVDPLTWRFHLRKGVKFTNGEPFNAESAKISFEAHKNAPMYERFTGLLDSATVVDEYTLDVKATVDTERIPMLMAMGSFQYPAKAYQEAGDEGFAAKPIGTGPFKLERWVKGDRIEMVANKDYWQGEPKVDRLVYRVIPDRSAAVAGLQAGELDLITDVPIGLLSRFESDENIKLVPGDNNRVYQLVFSMLGKDTPLKKPEVRRALQHAIDVKSLIDNNLAGYATPVKGQLLPPSFFGYEEDSEAIPYDPEKAKQMLADAGYPDGFPVTFNYTSGGFQQDRELGQAMAAMLEKVGITVEQEVLEPGTFATYLDSPRRLKDLWFSGSLPPPDAHYMYLQYKSDFPYSYYVNPEFDALFDKQAAAKNDEERLAVIRQMTQMLRENPPGVPLYQGKDLYGIRKGLTGFEPRVTQYIDIYPIAVD